MAKGTEVEFAGRLLDRLDLGDVNGPIGKKREIIKEGVSEYFLYTVEGRDTIPTGWSKRLPSFKAPDVPITSCYKFEQERWGDQVIGRQRERPSGGIQSVCHTNGVSQETQRQLPSSGAQEQGFHHLREGCGVGAVQCPGRFLLRM